MRLRPPAPLKAHMILTFERVKQLEDCEAELKKIKSGDPAHGQTGGGESEKPTDPSKWSNYPTIIGTEEPSVLDYQSPSHFEPLLARPGGEEPSRKRRRHDSEEDEEAADDGGMYGAGAAGPIDFPGQEKYAFKMQAARNSSANKQPNCDERGETGQVENEFPVSVVVPAPPVPASIARSPEKEKAEPICAVIQPPTIPGAGARRRFPWYYVGDLTEGMKNLKV